MAWCSSLATGDGRSWSEDLFDIRYLSQIIIFCICTNLSRKEVMLCRHNDVQIIAGLREILVIVKSILYGYQLAWSCSWKAWRMSRKATVTNGSFSQMYVVIGVNEKRKKSWLLNSPSGEVKCNAMQKKELSFSDSFPAIILYFQVCSNSQISLGNCTFWIFPGKTQHCCKKSRSRHVPTLPCRSSKHRRGLAELLSCWTLIPNELFYHPKPGSRTSPCSIWLPLMQ